MFQSHGEPPLPATPSGQPQPDTSQTENDAGQAAKANGPELTDAERSAITFTAYDLDARLTPASSAMAMHARLTLRNDSDTPLTRVAMQISSTLRWESVDTFSAGAVARTEFSQHLLDTDADHTGKANEAVITLPAPLLPGKTLELDVFYSGTAPLSTGRLQRLGAAHDQALAADWDEIAPGRTVVRGFGNVLWYPVASPQLFLGQGAELFNAIGHMEQREQEASIRLRLGVEYTGDPPTAAYFCGRRQALHAVPDDPNMPIAAGAGIATAEFAAQPIGFRLPSLVLAERPEITLAPLPLAGTTAPQTAMPEETSSSSSSASSSNSSSVVVPAEAPAIGAPGPLATNNAGGALLAVESEDEGALPPLAASAERVAPLLQQWLGVRPLSALTVIDHAGQPFEDGPLLVAPVSALSVSTALPAMAHSLTHAWVQTGQPWMDEGLAQFFSLLWTEREQGHHAATTQMDELLQPLRLAEPNIEEGKPAPPGQPLIAATSELYFRRKAAAVWWMLRGVAGDEALQHALQAWRVSTSAHTTAEADALAFEALLEKTSGQDLHWLFDDWVLHDRGLPDIEITDVAPRELPAGTGHESGWLVAVTVHNGGAAAAEVPVVVRSGTYSETKSLRVPGFSSATARVLVEKAPTEVLVNDGNTPEMRTSRHVRAVVQRVE